MSYLNGIYESDDILISGANSANEILDTDNIFTGENTFTEPIITNGVSNTGTMTTNDFTFNRASSTITIVNGNFQLPLKSQPPYFHQLATGPTTYAPNASFLTAQGFTGWGVSGSSYIIGMKTFGPSAPYYLTYFYPGTTQAFVLNGNGAATLTSQDYTLSLGNYIFSFALQSEASGPVSASILNSVGGTIASLTNINVSANYPNWVDFNLGFTITTTGTYKIRFSTTGGYACYYVGNLIYVPGMVITNGTNISGIGGQTSIMNKLYINNGAIIQSGGLGINGTISTKTAYGTNSMAINSTMGTGSTTSNTNCLAIGLANLQNSTTSNNVVALGNQIATLTTSATRMIGIGGARIFNELDSIIIGYNSGQTNQSRNVLVGNDVGGAVGSYNNAVGNYIFTQYNGYGGIYPSYCNAFGYGALRNLGDSFCCAFGHEALSALNGLGFGISYQTRYCSGFGHGAGSNQPRLNYCSFFGANTTASVNNLSYATAIGAGTVVDISNCIQLGSNSEIVKTSGDFYVRNKLTLPLFTHGTNNLVSVYNPAITTGYNNYLLGISCGTAITSGFNNYCSGLNVGTGLTNTSDYNNILIGRNIFTSTARNCTSSVVMSVNTTETKHNLDGTIIIGDETYQPAGAGPFQSTSNVCIGYFAMKYVGNTQNCVVIGTNSMSNATTTNFNTACGANSLLDVISGGQYNTAIGFEAGTNFLSNQYDCSGNTYLGANTETLGAYSNSTAVGSNAQISRANTIFLGTYGQDVSVANRNLLKQTQILTAASSTFDFGSAESIIIQSTVSTITLPTITSASQIGTTFILTKALGSFIVSIVPVSGQALIGQNRTYAFGTSLSAYGMDTDDYTLILTCIADTGNCWLLSTNFTRITNLLASRAFFPLSGGWNFGPNTNFNAVDCYSLGNGNFAATTQAPTTGAKLLAYGNNNFNKLGGTTSVSVAYGNDNFKMSLRLGSWHVVVGTNNFPIINPGAPSHITTPNACIAVGNNCFELSTDLSSNIVAVGHNVASTNAQTGSNNTLIGTETGFSAASSFSNSTALGYGSIITGNNQVVLGRSTETVRIPGNLNVLTNATISGDMTMSSNATITGTLNTTGVATFQSEGRFVSGARVFSSLICQNYNSVIAAATGLGTGPYYEWYSVSATTPFTITLPSITASMIGMEIKFRRVGGTPSVVVSFAGNGTQLVYNTQLTGGTGARDLMNSNIYIVRLVALLVSSPGTYAWFQW